MQFLEVSISLADDLGLDAVMEQFELVEGHVLTPDEHLADISLYYLQLGGDIPSASCSTPRRILVRWPCRFLH